MWHAGCYEADLIDQSWTANAEQCTDSTIVSSSSISGGVVCYNGTTEGSRAVYICNDGFVLMVDNEDTRVCQSDGMWNGSIPQCIPGTYCIANSEWVYASIFICMVRVIESISYACTQLICSTTCMLLASVVNLLANQLKFASAWIHSTMHHT